jgi:hypothetical protein
MEANVGEPITLADIARWRTRAWEIIVEPDKAEQVLVVITAYPVVKEKGS